MFVVVFVGVATVLLLPCCPCHCRRLFLVRETEGLKKFGSKFFQGTMTSKSWETDPFPYFRTTTAKKTRSLRTQCLTVASQKT